MLKLAALTFLLSSSYAAAMSELEREWVSFPYASLPALPKDTVMANFVNRVRHDGPLKVAHNSFNIFDTRNNYANFTVYDDSFLEFVVWTSKPGYGYIVANRYERNLQVYKVWQFEPQKQVREVASPFQLSRQDTADAYRRITGQEVPAGINLHWDFPRYGTTVTVSFEPLNAALLKKCAVVSDVEYDCGNRLDIASFRWTGDRFIKVLAR